MSLGALASPGDRRRAATAERLGIERSYRSMTEALERERFDGVVVTAPTRLHEPLALEALTAGCHVLCEKPMASDAAAGRRMLEAADRAGRVLAIGYQYPWMHPGLAGLAAAGELDGVFRIEAHWTRADGIPATRAFWDRPDAGAATDLLGHLLSVVQMGARSKPRRATAFAWNRFGRRAHGGAFQGHDTLEAIVVYEGGRTGHLVVAWATNMEEDESIGVTFHGTDVSVEVPLMGREVDVERFRPTVHRRVGAHRSHYSLAKPLPVQTEETFVLQARDWIEACHGGHAVRLSATDALEIQAALDAVVRSAALGGRTVDVEL